MLIWNKIKPKCNFFRHILSTEMAPPRTEKKVPKKRTGDGQMGYLKTRRSRDKAFDKKKEEMKKMKNRLIYLTKKETTQMLSSKERKEKKLLEKTLGKS